MVCIYLGQLVLLSRYNVYSKRDKMRDEKEDGIQAMAIFNKVPTYDRYENQPRSFEFTEWREGKPSSSREMHAHTQSKIRMHTRLFEIHAVVGGFIIFFHKNLHTMPIEGTGVRSTGRRQTY
jgi:hypothetical protein